MFVEMTYPAAVQRDVPGSGVALFPEAAVELWQDRGWVLTSELPALADESSDTETPPGPADKKPKSAPRGDSQE